MKIVAKSTLFFLIVLYLTSTSNFLYAASASDNTATKQPGKKVAGKSNTLETRIDFGNSYIMGQTIKSGAVYLLQRKKSEIKSMLKYRKDYRKEILEGFKIKEVPEYKTTNN